MSDERQDDNYFEVDEPQRHNEYDDLSKPVFVTPAELMDEMFQRAYLRALGVYGNCDPLRDCNYLLSLPRVCPGKAYRN